MNIILTVNPITVITKFTPDDIIFFLYILKKKLSLTEKKNQLLMLITIWINKTETILSLGGNDYLVKQQATEFGVWRVFHCWKERGNP